MVKHAGVHSAPFFVRESRTTEPETYPNGHPWGWVYQIADVLKDEVRWLTPEQYEELDTSLHREMARLDDLEMAQKQEKALLSESADRPRS